MTEWREVTLAEVCDSVDYGYTASATDDPDLPRFLRITDIVKPQIDWRGVPGCPIDAADLKKFAVAEGDIVVARTGATVGYAKRIKSHPDAVFASYLVRFRPADGVVPGYLGAVVESAAYKDWVRGNAGGAAQPNANARVLGAYPFILPPAATQRRIAEVSDAIDDLIENNRRRVEVLEEMARAIYREWFVHFRFPGHEDATFVDSDLGPIPEGWSWRPFTEVASFMNGFAFKPAQLGDEGRPVIKIKQLKGGVAADTPRSDPAAIKEKYWIEPGDLLMSWSAHLGVYWWMDEPGLLNQHLFKVSAVAEYPELYIFYDLDRAMPQFWDRAQGTTMRHIKRAALTEVHALAADAVVVERFVLAAEPLVASATVLRKASAELRGLRDLLLPKLVTGQIDVSGLDLDAVVEKAGV